MRRILGLLLCVALSLNLAACGKEEKGEEITIFAAASLKSSFEEIAKKYDGKVTFNFDGSQNLVSAIQEGAKADLLATADQKNMDKAVDVKLVQTPKVFASNTLVAVTPKGNPAGITGLDASLNGKKLVICAVGVPCGNATDELAKKVGTTLQPVSEEQRVTDVLGKVTSGEADAGIVYATDAKGASEKVDTIPIEGADKVINKYPIAITAWAQQAGGAKKFMDLVLSDEGRKILEANGFKAG